MPIVEYYSREEEKEFGHGTTFHVHDELMVFDRRLAHALNHLSNHIQALTHLASSYILFTDTELNFLVANHPHLRNDASSLLSSVSEQPWDFERMEACRSKIIRCLIDETKALVEISASMACAIEHESETEKASKPEVESIDKLEQDLAQIPFIDFHSVVDQRPSIVKVINL